VLISRITNLSIIKLGAHLKSNSSRGLNINN